jgi:hypothetical protein
MAPDLARHQHSIIAQNKTATFCRLDLLKTAVKRMGREAYQTYIQSYYVKVKQIPTEIATQTARVQK